MTKISTEAYVIHEANGGFHPEIIYYDGIGEHEILVENVAVAVCHTDIKAQQGGFSMKPPMVPGHECAGIDRHSRNLPRPRGHRNPFLRALLGLQTLSLGKTVLLLKLLDLNFSGTRLDGSRPVTDKDGKELNGFFFGQSSMARLVLAHENGAVKVEVGGGEAGRSELRSFAALACGVQTGAGAIFNVLRPPINSSIAIFGTGAVGLSACFAARLSNPSHLILIDNFSEKLSHLPPDLGTTHIIDASSLPASSPSTSLSSPAAPNPLVAKLMEITEGEGVDFVIDAVGRPEVLQDGHAALAKCGTLLTLGGIAKPAGLPINLHLLKGATYRGSHQGDAVSRTFIPKMIELWRKGKFPFDGLLTYYPFEELDRALEDVAAGRVVKPVLTFQSWLTGRLGEYGGEFVGEGSW